MSLELTFVLKKGQAGIGLLFLLYLIHDFSNSHFIFGRLDLCLYD